MNQETFRDLHRLGDQQYYRTKSFVRQVLNHQLLFAQFSERFLLLRDYQQNFFPLSIILLNQYQNAIFLNADEGAKESKPLLSHHLDERRNTTSWNLLFLL